MCLVTLTGAFFTVLCTFLAHLIHESDVLLLDLSKVRSPLPVRSRSTLYSEPQTDHMGVRSGEWTGPLMGADPHVIL